MAMDEEIKRWTARREAAVVLEIIQGKTTVAEVRRQLCPMSAEGAIRRPQKQRIDRYRFETTQLHLF